MLKRSELYRSNLNYREPPNGAVTRPSLVGIHAAVSRDVSEFLLTALCLAVEDATGGDTLWEGIGEWVEQLIPE